MVCVWFPSWPLQRVASTHPEVKSQAVIVYTGTNGSARVTACSKLAKAQGVRISMPLAEAQALCGDPSTLHLEPDDPAADRECLRNVAERCEKFTPLFGIENNERPECLVLDVTGSVPLWGTSTKLLNALVEELLQQGFQPRVAMAPTFGAAWAAAHYWANAERHPVLEIDGAKESTSETPLATKTRDEEALAQMLARLPLAALRLPASVVTLLEELGVRTIGELRALPRSSLPSRFGPTLIQRLNQALGIEPELWTRVEPRQPLVASWIGEYPLAGDDELRCVCEDRLQSLMPRLEQRREGIRQLLCRARVPGGQTQEWCLDFTAPVTSVPHALNMLALQWERQQPKCDIIAVHVEITQYDSLQWRSRNLFGEYLDGDNDRSLRELIDRLSNRLGREAVLRAELLPEVHPERSVAYQPFAESTTSATSTSSTKRQRPWRLLTEPQPIPVSRAGPEGAPLSFGWNQTEHRVIRSWGPERIETGWWHDAPIARDYFRVETQSGLHFWLFLNLIDFGWFLHGTFD